MSLQKKISKVIDDIKYHPTSDYLAIYLKANGIKGQRASTLYCPIAVFIRKRTKKFLFFDRKVRTGLGHFTVDGIEFILPTVAIDFINAFDNQRYPDLES